ncbi:MAG TPA: hypothetical protein VFL27_03445 [Candidatus Dormibacteraeota bacterium]|nr:hypothetical protein [Candidatus Dormibacteraeota bacterium]
MATVQQPPMTGGREHSHRQLSAIGWGLLFIWVGMAALFDVGWGYGLIGVGVIILGSQIAHMMVGEHQIDFFSTIVGVMFVFGGVWILFGIQVSLVPILIIVAGVALLLSALTSRPAR